jgi:hypothetical protein
MLFSVPCFGEEKEKNWELEYWKNQKQLCEIAVLNNKLQIENSQLKIKLLLIEKEKAVKEIEKLQGKESKE